MTDPTLWNQLLVWPILNILIALYKGLSTLGIPGAFGFAIIALTVIIRGLLWPLTQTQLKSAQKLQRLKPKLDELSKKHGKDRVKLQQAQLDLYREHGVNPASGCLPLLVQLPVFIALYNVFIQVLNAQAQQDVVASINTILYHPGLSISELNLSFFGVSLATKPNEWQTVGIGLLLIPLITGILQYAQTRLMTPSVSSDQPNQKRDEDPMLMMQKQMALIMPVMIGFFSLSFPIGLSLYWNMFTLFSIMQQIFISKRG